MLLLRVTVPVVLLGVTVVLSISYIISFGLFQVAEKFAATFGLQPVLTNLFQGFWCLDHKDFEVSLFEIFHIHYRHHHHHHIIIIIYYDLFTDRS